MSKKCCTFSKLRSFISSNRMMSRSAISWFESISTSVVCMIFIFFLPTLVPVFGLPGFVLPPPLGWRGRGWLLKRWRKLLGQYCYWPATAYSDHAGKHLDYGVLVAVSLGFLANKYSKARGCYGAMPNNPITRNKREEAKRVRHDQKKNPDRRAAY